MPKIVDHEERRNAIAAAAARIIAERGIDDVPMVAIAEAAGVTTGAVTHYFQDKDEVILAALRWADGAMQARAARAFEKHDDVVSIILAALPTNEESRIEWLVWAVFADRATRTPELHAEHRARSHQWQELAKRVLGEMREQGALDTRINIDLEAKLAVALIDGLGYHASTDPESWSEEEQRAILRQYVDRLRKS